MKMNIYFRMLIVSCVMIHVNSRTLAQSPLTNGDFQADQSLFEPWDSIGNVNLVAHGSGLGKFIQMDEPGVEGVSQIWQTFSLPTSPVPSFLTFRYRFARIQQDVRPRLITAVSRKQHPFIPIPEFVDFDILAGETECRSATIAFATTDLLVVVTFDRKVTLLGRTGGDVVTDVGTIGSLVLLHNTVEIPITGVPHAARIHLSYPGIVDWEFPVPGNSSDIRLCVVNETGDYNSDGETNAVDITAHTADFPDPADATLETARADWNLDGSINGLDQSEVQSLLPLSPMGCPNGRPLQKSNPPDSFLAFLLNQSDNNPVTGLLFSVPSFTNAFFYEDSNGLLIYDQNWVGITPDTDEEGMYQVSLKIDSVTNPDVRIAFALASAQNDVSSMLSLDDVNIDCPSLWCCDPATGFGLPTDDGDPCMLESCDTATGEITYTPSDTVPPIITCPADTVVTDRNKKGPEYTGYATATDNCTEPTITDPPDQVVNIGCPTVIHRNWEASDGTNSDTCMQYITDLDSDAPFYACLENRIQYCFGPPNIIPGITLDYRFSDTCDNSTVTGCSCSLGERLTECFKKLVNGEIANNENAPGQIQSKCVNPLVDELSAITDENGESIVDIPGVVKSCTANDLHDLFNWILSVDLNSDINECSGGPEGTDVCRLHSDCPSDYLSTTNDCCYKKNPADQFGWCVYSEVQCVPEL